MSKKIGHFVANLTPQLSTPEWWANKNTFAHPTWLETQVSSVKGGRFNWGIGSYQKKQS